MSEAKMVTSSFSAHAVGPVVFVVWRGEVTLDAVEEVSVLLHETAHEYREVAFITIAQFKAPIPSASVRGQIVQTYAELGEKLVGVAQVVEGEGFWASAALCFIAGLGLLHRRGHAMKIFGRVPEGLAWIDTLPLKHGVPLGDLARLIEQGTAQLARAA